MRKFAALLTAVGLSATSALGATVSFAPNPGGSDTVNAAALPTTVNFDLLVGLGTGNLSSIDIVVGSNGPLTVNSFAYAQDFIDNALLPPPAPSVIGIYTPDPANDLYFGGAQRVARTGANYRLGSLTIGVPGGLAPGDYTFAVSSDFDQFSNLNGGDPLSGVGTVHVVPEPATLGLLALGALGLIRRRLA